MHKLVLTVLVATSLLIPAAAFAATGDPKGILASGWLVALMTTFGIGVTTALTPCVYPMIPIVVGVFGARDANTSRRKAFFLGLSYVLGMCTLYSTLGVVFALLGMQFGTVLANPWVVIPMVLLYLALAMSMFGAFEIGLPTALQQRLNTVGGKGYGGAFGLGLVGGLTAAPCTGPFLALIIGFVVETRDALAGFLLMFTYAFGIGILFLVLAVFAISLPRSGRWMEGIKNVGGVGLIVAAIYFLRPVVPEIVRITSASYAFLASSIGLGSVGLCAMLGVMFVTIKSQRKAQIIKYGGAVLAVVGLTGTVNWLLTPKSTLPWRYDEAVALAEANEAGKGVLIDFSAEWCAPCKELEKITFSDPLVFAEITDRFVPLKIDMTTETPLSVALSKKYDRTAALPTLILLDSDLKEATRVEGRFVGPDEFLGVMRTIAVD